MIVMNIKIDNFFAFQNFHMNMSYPKKIIDSSIEREYLKERLNFRYKKVNILMGANATGKTSFGKMLMKIFNFMDKKQFEKLTEAIADETKQAALTMDFVVKQYKLYRIDIKIRPKQGEEYKDSDINLHVKAVDIKTNDSYETCARRIEELAVEETKHYIEELEKIEGLSWLFEYPSDSQINYKIRTSKNSKRYIAILERTLRTLDPSVQGVEKLDKVDNAYVIKMKNHSVIMQEGKLLDANVLSSGTKAGVEIAGVIVSMLDGGYGFYYCDEKFPYIHSDIEKAFLSVMIQCLQDNDQLFFTTHNTDILDLSLPKHSFLFLKKDANDENQPIKCISASQLLKRNTDSLRHAVENDLFSTAPKVELIYEIAEL